MNRAQWQKALDAYLNRFEPEIAKALQQVIAAMGAAAPIKDIVEALNRGDVEAVVRLLQHTASIYFPFSEALRQAYMGGGAFAISQLPTRSPFSGDRLVISFNGNHNRAVAWLNNYTEDTITGLTAQQQAAVRSVISIGLDTNRNTAEIARDLVGRIDPNTGRRVGGILGLNDGQTKLILKARQVLEAGDADGLAWYMQLASRDINQDRIINRALREGRKLTAAEINQILGRHSDKLAYQRGLAVARTEAYAALSAGQHEGWTQALDNGLLRAGDVTKRWQHSRNIPARPDHVGMNGRTIAFNELFMMPDGTRMQHAHDPAGGPKNNINCHCTTFYRLRKGRD